MDRLIGSRKGFVLLTVLGMIAVSFIIGSAYMGLSSNEVSLAKQYTDSVKSFYLAETGLERIMYDIKLGHIQSKTFKVKNYSPNNNYLDDIVISVNVTSLGQGQYEVSSTSTIGNSARTVHGLINKNPPAHVFDYGYFINNWGWFYGRGITCNGDVRSNGRFDFRDNPRVEGDIYAGQGIDDETQDGVAQNVKGKGGEHEDGNYLHQHPYSEKETVPMLQDLTYYQDLALQKSGTVSIDSSTVINGVYGDDPGEVGSIILIGTPSQPITINGPVVVTGDVIIKGTVSGQGTIYAGRNIYIAGDIVYKNAPSSPRPASDNPSVVDGWVEAHQDNDLVGFAARESIVLGDYTASEWSRSVTPYLYSMGSEDVGRDGIPDTHDQGEGDGSFDTQYEDLDGDGVFDTNYNLSSVQTSGPVTNFANCPQGVTNFRDLATNSINKVEGVLYTNHAIVGILGSGVHFNGAVISKDEAMLYRNTFTINYDERLHSRYRENPNWLINLNLPVANKVDLVSWWE